MLKFYDFCEAGASPAHASASRRTPSLRTLCLENISRGGLRTRVVGTNVQPLANKPQTRGNMDHVWAFRKFQRPPKFFVRMICHLRAAQSVVEPLGPFLSGACKQPSYGMTGSSRPLGGRREAVTIIDFHLISAGQHGTTKTHV